MKARNICLSAILFCFFVFSCGGVFAQGLPEPKPSCAYCGAAIWKGESHRPGCPYATKKATPNAPPVGGYGSPEAFAAQMMGSLLGSLFQSILAPPQPDTSYQQKLIKQQIEKQKQEALKKQAMERWKKLREEEEARLAEEEARKRQRGQELLAKMESTGGGSLEPFGWETSALTPQPIGTGTYDTSGYTSWQRMLCAAYFSSKALEATRSGDPEGAVFMNRQADRVMAGEMTEVECQICGLQQLGEIQRQNIRMNNRLAEMVKLLPTVQEKVRHLQQIEIKLNEAKKERAVAEKRLEEAREKVQEAKVKAEAARAPEEKSEADDLLRQALALKDEASIQLEKVKEQEKQYIKLKDGSLKELKNLKMQITGESLGRKGN